MRPEHFLFAAVPVVSGRRPPVGRGLVRRDQQGPGRGETLRRMRDRVHAEVQPGQILPGLRGADAPEERGRTAAKKIPDVYAFKPLKSLLFRGFPGTVGGQAGQIIQSPPEQISKCVENNP